MQCVRELWITLYLEISTYYTNRKAAVCFIIPTRSFAEKLAFITIYYYYYYCYCYYYYYYYYYYYWYSALGPVWAETRAQSGDWYGSGTLHPGQLLRGSLPLLSPAFKMFPLFTTRCLHVRHDVRDPRGGSGNCGQECCPVILPK